MTCTWSTGSHNCKEPTLQQLQVQCQESWQRHQGGEVLPEQKVRDLVFTILQQAEGNAICHGSKQDSAAQSANMPSCAVAAVAAACKQSQGHNCTSLGRTLAGTHSGMRMLLP